MASGVDLRDVQQHPVGAKVQDSSSGHWAGSRLRKGHESGPGGCGCIHVLARAPWTGYLAVTALRASQGGYAWAVIEGII